MNDIWLDTLRNFPFDERWLFSIGFVFAYVIGFWIPNILLWIGSKFEWFLKFKIQKTTSWPESDLVWSAVKSNFGALLTLQPLIGKKRLKLKKE